MYKIQNTSQKHPVFTSLHSFTTLMQQFCKIKKKAKQKNPNHLIKYVLTLVYIPLQYGQNRVTKPDSSQPFYTCPDNLNDALL